MIEKQREYDNIWLWLKDAIEELVNNKLDESRMNSD